MSYPKNDLALKEVQRIFKEVRDAVTGLENIIMGQRRINGSLYAANEKIVKILKELDARTTTTESRQSTKIAGRKVNAGTKAKPIAAILNDAQKYLDGVGGKEPPGCQVPPG